MLCVAVFISDHLAEEPLEDGVREVVPHLGRMVFLRWEIEGEPAWFGE